MDRPSNTARSRVLFAWEHGRNFGHVIRLSEIAKLVREKDTEPMWAVPRAYLKHPLIAGNAEWSSAAPQVQPSGCIERERVSTRCYSFADILIELGFADVEVIGKAVAQWLRLFEIARPDSLLCDYAPAAQLAAYIAGLPVTQVTNGFDAPPADLPMFESTLRGPYFELANAKKVAQLSETVAAVGRALGRAESSLAGFLGWSTKMIDVIPEIDPYGPRTDAIYVGPFTSAATSCAARWPDEGRRRSKRVYAYLRGQADAQGLLRGLVESQAAILCVWPDAPAGEFGKYDDSQVHLTRQPVDLSAALSQADAVVNYGSSAVVCAALLAGKPQLMAPTDVEKLMFSQRIEGIGAGIVWPESTNSYLISVGRLLDDATLSSFAGIAAARHKLTRLKYCCDTFAGS